MPGAEIFQVTPRSDSLLCAVAIIYTPFLARMKGNFAKFLPRAIAWRSPFPRRLLEIDLPLAILCIDVPSSTSVGSDNSDTLAWAIERGEINWRSNLFFYPRLHPTRLILQGATDKIV